MTRPPPDQARLTRAPRDLLTHQLLCPTILASNMANSKKRDPIPKHFKSVQEAGDFWDSHDLADYWDLTREAHFDVDIQQRVFLTALEPELAKRLATCSHKQGISAETLINLWLTEKMAEVAQSK